MKVEVHFTHMDRSETLEQQVLEKVGVVLQDLLHRETAHAQVWLVSDHSRHHAKGVPEYRCEIEVRVPPRKDCFVSKTDPDMSVAIHDAIGALKSMLRAGAKREIALARHS